MYMYMYTYTHIGIHPSSYLSMTYGEGLARMLVANEALYMSTFITICTNPGNQSTAGVLASYWFPNPGGDPKSRSPNSEFSTPMV